jgi:KipI family sensor histidine kinase inhibitor
VSPVGEAPANPPPDPKVVPFGDSAVLLVLDEVVDPRLAARSQAIAAAVEVARADQPGLGRAVPAHASVLVPFDPLAIELETVSRAVERCARDARRGDDPAGDNRRDELLTRQTLEIHVRYGGEDGPDLDEVAVAHDLRPSDVVELHAEATYTVLFLGFAPGFAYLGGLLPRLITPRRATPRPRVPAGSVGIAGEQTGIYPLAMPGGWQLIGRTDATLWDPTSSSPARLQPGDHVRFVPER